MRLSDVFALLVVLALAAFASAAGRAPVPLRAPPVIDDAPAPVKTACPRCGIVGCDCGCDANGNGCTCAAKSNPAPTPYEPTTPSPRIESPRYVPAPFTFP